MLDDAWGARAKENSIKAEKAKLRKLAKRQAGLAVEIAEREMMMELAADG